MKICKITQDVYELYDCFIPNEQKIFSTATNMLGFGFYDENGVHGAATVSFCDSVASIDSFICEKDVEEGICEKLLTNLLIMNAKRLNVSEIVLIKEGTEKSLDEYDKVMLSLRYAPRNGDVSVYYSTLETICDSLGDFLEAVRKKIEISTIIPAKDAMYATIEEYNDSHQGNPYNEKIYDSRLSMFYMKGERAIAGIMGQVTDEGDLNCAWMDYDSDFGNLNKITLMVAQLLNAEKYYPKETKVFVCPFLREVELLVKKLGFKKDMDNPVMTRIYTYYLNE